MWVLWVLLAQIVCAQTRPQAAPGSPTFTTARQLAKLASTVPNWCKSEPYASEMAPTQMVRGGQEFKVYHNIWYHNGKWYALGDDTASMSSVEEGVTVNTGLIKVPTGNISLFTSTLRTCFVRGVTLLVDFPFPAFPDNLGHFAEVMLPTFSVLHQGEFRQLVQGAAPGQHVGVDAVLLVNLRKPLYDWFSEVLAVTLGAAAANPDLPRHHLVDQVELEGFDKLGWLVFENLLVVQDRYTHPQRLSGFIAPDHGDMWKHDGCERYVSAKWKVGFLSPDIATEFRRRAYRRHNWTLPASDSWTPGTPPAIPKVITLLLYAEDHPQLINGPAVFKMLREVGEHIGWEVRQATLTMEAPFLSHLDTMARTGLLVARHGPLLANAVLLPPGAAVMELLPYKWEWQRISHLYYNMTQLTFVSNGIISVAALLAQCDTALARAKQLDQTSFRQGISSLTCIMVLAVQSTDVLHHLAWRPTDHKWCAYKEPSDIRYHTWTPDECSSRECLVVHARAGLIVDVDAVHALLLRKLPGVLAGQPVAALRDEFPKAS